MSTPAPQCQPSTKGAELSVEQTLAFFKSVIHSGESWSSTCQNAFDSAKSQHASLKSRAEQAERAVDVLESNARVQAKLLADTGRRVEELEGALTQIKKLKPEPVADGFVTGPQALLDAAKRIARLALSEAKPAGETKA